jgi:hypothetical protein
MLKKSASVKKIEAYLIVESEEKEGGGFDPPPSH